MKTIFTLISVLLTFASYAQTYAKPRAIVTNPNSCNNTVVLEIYNNTPHGWVYHTKGYWWNGGTQTIVHHMDTIEDVCYNDSVSGTHGFDLFSSNGYIHTSLLYSTIITPDFNYTVSSYVAPTSRTSEDGSFTLDFDGNVTGYDLNIFQDAAHEPTVTIVDSNTLSLSNLNVGFITIHIDNPLDGYDYAHFRIYAGDPNDDYVNDGLDLNISYHNAGSTCEGWINIQTANAIGQTYYYWADDSLGELAHTTTRTNLCPGTYHLYTQSAHYYGMDSVASIGHIDTIVITGDTTTHIAPELFSVEMDVIEFYSETYYCWVDDWETLDSMKHSVDTLLYADSLLIVTYDTTKYVGNITFSLHDSLILVADSVVLFNRIIYCDEIIPEEEFMLQSLDLKDVIDNQEYEALLYTPEPDESVQAILYPNPTQGDLHIDFKKTGTYKIQIIDYRGRLIETVYAVNDDELLIPTTNMVNGIYILLIHSEDGVQQHRFVKQ